jgi:hypothetical protein
MFLKNQKGEAGSPLLCQLAGREACAPKPAIKVLRNLNSNVQSYFKQFEAQQ